MAATSAIRTRIERARRIRTGYSVAPVTWTAVTSFLDIAPILPTADMERMQSHYELLGYTVHVHQGGYATAERGDVKMHFHLSPDHDVTRDGGAVYIAVEDADALHAEWTAAGVAPLGDLWDPGFGVWESAHTDPDGNVIRFGSPVRQGPRS
jgi:predicted enzyme related to lactoylglutathione lyase